jgi:L-rhamnose mutarotase
MSQMNRDHQSHCHSGILPTSEKVRGPPNVASPDAEICAPPTLLWLNSTDTLPHASAAWSVTLAGPSLWPIAQCRPRAFTRPVPSISHSGLLLTDWRWRILLPTQALCAELKEGCRDQYIEMHHHATVTQRLRDINRKAGVTKEQIFLFGNLIFLYGECEDVDRMNAVLAADGLAAQW